MMLYNNNPLKYVQNKPPSLEKSSIYTYEDANGSKTTAHKTTETKGKQVGFGSMLSLMKMTFSSSQIEGRCLGDLSEYKNENKVSETLNSGSINHLNTNEELTSVFQPMRVANSGTF